MCVCVLREEGKEREKRREENVRRKRGDRLDSERGIWKREVGGGKRKQRLSRRRRRRSAS